MQAYSVLKRFSNSISLIGKSSMVRSFIKWPPFVDDEATINDGCDRSGHNQKKYHFGFVDNQFDILFAALKLHP